MGRSLHLAAVCAALLALAACGGSGNFKTPSDHGVTISWAANHEKGVNGPGGGYRVTIAGRPTIDLAYDAGAGFAPTSITTVLRSGTYGVSVVAYQPLAPSGALTGGVSAPATLTVVVP
jgi:hypothetical protein